MSNLEAAQSGSVRRALEEARDTLARSLDAAEARGDGTVAQLAAQYRATLAELAALPAEEAKSPSERLKERIAAANAVA